MTEPIYQIRYSPFDEIYTFESVGKYGSIQKVVSFIEFKDNVFNIGFGDLDPFTDEIDDKIVSDNGDMKTVLATIIAIIKDFSKKNPSAYIYFEGSSKSRTRLYQIVMNLYYDDFSQDFELFGSVNDDIVEPF
jgi:hypothetical protein